MKKLVLTLMAAAFLFSAGAALAAKCTVDSVDGMKVTVTCDKVDVKAGDNVTLKGAKKGLEGC